MVEGKQMIIQMVKKLICNYKSRYMKKASRRIPYLNKPIEQETEDEIGMGVYVDYLESAIEQGASMISVVSSFGTGKSSLVELMKVKYQGKEIMNGNTFYRNYCQVNLWSQMENENDSIELHRTFLYQLIASIRPELGSYFSRRTSKNFGVLKINTNKPWRDAGIVGLLVIFSIITVCKAFSDVISGSGLVDELLLNKMTLIGYGICIVGAVLIAMRAELTFSSRNSEGKRQTEENELIDLYRENILIPRKWYKLPFEKFVKRKHFVIIIEDLDRTADGESVYRFLQELRKYYVPAEQLERTFRNRTTFIVNIMPEDLLRTKCKESNLPKEYVYEKMFDYTLNLNRINIDNFDAVLEALILEKKDEFLALGFEVKDSDNVHNIDGMQWLIHGKNLTLRDVKARLNDAMLLYESLRLKFGAEHVDFSKCAVTAYLRNVFSESFYRMEDDLLDRMLKWYAVNAEHENAFLSDFLGECSKYGKEFMKMLFWLISHKLIDGNYRSYFFNYPKESYLYSLQETEVRNLIIYDEKMKNGFEEVIAKVAQTRETVITEAFDTAVELVNNLPDATLQSETLWNVAHEKQRALLYRRLMSHMSQIKEWSEDKKEICNKVIRYKGGPTLLNAALRQNDDKCIVEIRDDMLDNHRDKIENFCDLFQIEDYPVMENEVEKMKDIPIQVVLKFLPQTLENVSLTVIEAICERVETDKENASLADVEKFYEKIVWAFSVEEIANRLVAYMLTCQHSVQEQEDTLFEGIEAEKISTELYYTLINNLPIEEITEVQLERVHILDEPGNVSVGICRKMLQTGRLCDYLKNVILLEGRKIELSIEQMQTVLQEDGSELFKKHRGIFEKIRDYICTQYKNEAIGFQELFLYPYPFISENELKNISDLKTALMLMDETQMDEDGEKTFIEYCNRQYRPRKDAYAIFQYIVGLPEDKIQRIFYALEMKKINFAGMSGANKKEIVELFRIPLNLVKSTEIVKFMDFTQCLQAELEEEIADELKEETNKELQKEYVNTINKMNKITKETLRNIRIMPTIYNYSEMIDEELYEKKMYRIYVSSQIQKKEKFEIEYDKLENLWGTYLRMIKSTSGFGYSQPIMQKNLEFLKLIQEREAYKDMVESRRMIMAVIPQSGESLKNILNYSENFVTEYYSKMAGFQDKNAAEVFVEIMKQNQKYAQKKEIYEHVHDKLENGSLKRKYTNLYRKANE